MGDSLPADITNTTSLTVVRNRLKTFIKPLSVTVQLTNPAVKRL